MFDNEILKLTEAILSEDTILVLGHSGHRLRFFYDVFPFLIKKTGVTGSRSPIPILISSLKNLLGYLKHSFVSSRYIFFVNTDIFPVKIVKEILRYHGSTRHLRIITLHKLHHNCRETLRLLELLDHKNKIALNDMKFGEYYAEENQETLIIPEESVVFERSSRLLNSTDASLISRSLNVRSFYSKCIKVGDDRLWTDNFIFERILPYDSYGNPFKLLSNAIQSVTQREIVLIDVSDIREGVERAAFFFTFSLSESCNVKEIINKVIKTAKGLGWLLIAQTTTSMSFDMPHRVIYLWSGARIALKDGGLGTVKGFKKAPSLLSKEELEWPIIKIDGEKDEKLILPSIVPLRNFSKIRILELPLRYGDNITAKQLFLSSHSALEGRSWVLRPNLFLGRLSLLRCTLASIPTLSQVVLTSPVPWELLMGVEKF